MKAVHNVRQDNSPLSNVQKSVMKTGSAQKPYNPITNPISKVQQNPYI